MSSSTMILYLGGAIAETVELTLPAFSDELDFETNVLIREKYVQYQKDILKTMNTRKLLAAKWDYDIVMVITSRVNSFQLSDEDLESFEHEIQSRKTGELITYEKQYKN